LEERNIEGYIPDQRMESLRKGTCQHPEFQRSKFRYDEGEDCYLCPMGKVLPYKGLLRGEGKPDIRIYRAENCSGCERKGECTKGEFPIRYIAHNLQKISNYITGRGSAPDLQLKTV
jgi:hypothetical protein